MSKSKYGFVHWLTTLDKTSSNKGMAGWLIKRRIAKNKFMAKTELIIIALLFFVSSYLVFIII